MLLKASEASALLTGTLAWPLILATKSRRVIGAEASTFSQTIAQTQVMGNLEVSKLCLVLQLEYSIATVVIQQTWHRDQLPRTRNTLCFKNLHSKSLHSKHAGNACFLLFNSSLSSFASCSLALRSVEVMPVVIHSMSIVPVAGSVADCCKATCIWSNQWLHNAK